MSRSHFLASQDTDPYDPRQYLASRSFKPPRPLSGLEAAKKDGWKGLYILTCADSRIMPEEIFGLKKGEASVIRNAGGRAIESDVFRTLAVMSSIATIGTFIVLHHTGELSLLFHPILARTGTN